MSCVCPSPSKRTILCRNWRKVHQVVRECLLQHFVVDLKVLYGSDVYYKFHVQLQTTIQEIHDT